MSKIYAIGDVHGRSDLLQKIIDFVDRHSSALGERPRVFFLGDIVDRGHDSRGAMEIVRKTLERWPASRLILGNHDEMWMNVLRNPEDEVLSRKWLANGGDATLSSYGGMFAEFHPDLIADILERFQDHFDLLATASDFEVVGKCLFVHAGIDPGLPLADQDPLRMRRIRQEFLDHVGMLPHIVVHGHSTLEPARPVVTENRISLDTFAYHSNVLSVAVIDPQTETVDFYSTHSDGSVQTIAPIHLDRGFGTALKAA